MEALGIDLLYASCSFKCCRVHSSFRSFRNATHLLKVMLALGIDISARVPSMAVDVTLKIGCSRQEGWRLIAPYFPWQLITLQCKFWMLKWRVIFSCFHSTTNTLNQKSMDPDESGIQPLQTSSYPPPALVSQHHDTDIESQLSNTLDRHYERRYSEKMQPVFDVASPTPIIFTAPPNKHKSEEQHPSTRPSTPTDSSSNAMVLSSPVISFSQAPPSPVKRRVFFGPRTGCEKCRLGVKGHFIHSE